MTLRTASASARTAAALDMRVAESALLPPLTQDPSIEHVKPIQRQVLVAPAREKVQAATSGLPDHYCRCVSISET